MDNSVDSYLEVNLYKSSTSSKIIKSVSVCFFILVILSLYRIKTLKSYHIESNNGFLRVYCLNNCNLFKSNLDVIINGEIQKISIINKGGNYIDIKLNHNLDNNIDRKWVKSSKSMAISSLVKVFKERS